MNDMSAAKKIYGSAFRTTPQGEFKARDELLLQNITAEIPFELRWSKCHHRQKQAKPSERPLMTGYVIVRAKRDDGLADAVRRTKHVKRYVGSIRDGEMSSVHRVNGRKINEPAPAAVEFKVGDHVHIPKGRFSGIVAKVVRVEGQSVHVEYKMLGSTRTSIVGAYDLVRPPA